MTGSMGFVIPTQADNVAFNIALGVLLLSVVLHPIVRGCFHRIRADMAWRKVKKEEAVEVTKYNLFSETLGDRGRWDTARFVTFLLAGFHVATWGLELSLDLALRTDGPVDLLNRPPPVSFLPLQVVLDNPQFRSTDWLVLGIKGELLDEGALGNFRGTWDDGNATASYRVGSEIIRGNTLSSWWSGESVRLVPGLFYDVNHGQGRAMVRGTSCSTTSFRTANVYVSEEPGHEVEWGTVTECESGPVLVNTSTTAVEAIQSPPVILLNKTGGDFHLIVEESSSYPSFLYSVWTPVEVAEMNGSVELSHVFYVASTTRLAEAIVSGVVNGATNGGYCVDLLSKFSVTNATYGAATNSRVAPFGERPFASSVETLDIVEPIVAGVQVNEVGLVCGVLLFVVTTVAMIGAVVGCLCWRSHRPLDVYNRDQLIRAVSMPSGEGADGKPAALKIYVRQEKNNKAFSIVISDDGVYRGFNGLRKRLSSLISAERGQRSGSVDSASTHGVSRSGSVPAGSRALSFTGVRPALVELNVQAPDDPGSLGPSRILELVASPVPQGSSAPHSPPSLGVLPIAGGGATSTPSTLGQRATPPSIDASWAVCSVAGAS